MITVRQAMMILAPYYRSVPSQLWCDGHGLLWVECKGGFERVPRDQEHIYKRAHHDPGDEDRR